MVIDEFNMEAGTGYFIVRPNRSLSWRTNQWIIASIALVCSTIAIVWSYFGAWMILPFAGIEVLVVAICFYLCVLKTTNQEVIYIEPTYLVVEHGRRKPQIRTKLLRSNVKLQFDLPDNEWENGQLTFIDDEKTLEVGRYLNRFDKNTLAIKLRRALSCGHQN